MTINEIVGRNVKAYIEAIGKSHKWVYEKAGIAKPTFYNLLKGEGDVSKSVEKLNQLFRISNPTYFYDEEIKLPKNVDALEQASIKNFSAASFNAKDSEAFRETMGVLDDMMTIIHALKSAKNIK